MSDPLFQAKALCRDFKLNRTAISGARPVRHAVADLNLKIETGDRLGVVGESGSGKTTLAKLLLNLDKPTSGSLTFNGQLFSKINMAIFRRKVQIIFQDPRSSLNPQMTVAQIILEPLVGLNFEQNHQQRIDQVLQQVELAPAIKSRYPHELSGGQRQRVAADEPVSALDVLVREEILQLLSGLIKTLNLTLVLISHDLSVITRLCNTVVVMQQGRIVEAGNTQDVFANPQHQFTKDLISAVPRLPTLD
ncbi:MAG: ABC transporter ATP-binding protein [Actinobacteria bacterium]|nr:ABC transporter ATP-binding protein [Actinomycetota bacterium]